MSNPEFDKDIEEIVITFKRKLHFTTPEGLLVMIWSVFLIIAVMESSTPATTTPGDASSGLLLVLSLIHI